MLNMNEYEKVKLDFLSKSTNLLGVPHHYNIYIISKLSLKYLKVIWKISTNLLGVSPPLAKGGERLHPVAEAKEGLGRGRLSEDERLAGLEEGGKDGGGKYLDGGGGEDEMDGEAGTRFEAGTRKLTDIFFAIFLVWQVSSFWFLDSSF